MKGKWAQVISKELEDIGLEYTSQYDPYEDEIQNEQLFLQQADVGDYSIGAEIILPRGDKMTRGYVVAFSYDVNGNAMSKAHTDPILDTSMYQA